MRRLHIATGLLVVAGLMLSGCSGESGDSPEPSGSYTPPATSSGEASPTPIEIPTDFPYDLPEEAGIPTSSGANAAPSGTGSIYLTDQQAVDNYYAWVTYEFQMPQDWNRSFETDTYPAGVYVCAESALGSRPSVIEQKLAADRGYTGSGASAIVKGALNALCPWNNQGYMTYFDRNVESVRNAMATRFSWNNGVPVAYEIGFFTKEVCTYLGMHGTTGLWELLQSMKPGGANSAHPAAVIVSYAWDDQVLRQFVTVSALHGCPGYHSSLGPFYTMA